MCGHAAAGRGRSGTGIEAPFHRSVAVYNGGTPVSSTTQEWLFVRRRESVRIVIDGTTMTVYGPGTRFSHSRFSEALDATLHQAAVEQALVLDGWTLEQLTTERRAPVASVHARPPRAERRRSTLQLVPNPNDRG